MGIRQGQLGGLFPGMTLDLLGCVKYTFKRPVKAQTLGFQLLQQFTQMLPQRCAGSMSCRHGQPGLALRQQLRPQGFAFVRQSRSISLE